MFRFLFSKRRNTFFKCLGIISIVIFYFGFLFRESLNAYEINKGGTIFKDEPRPRSSYKRSRIIIEKFSNIDNIKFNELSKTISTLNPVYEYSEELHSATERELLLRKSHLWNICIKENITGIYPPNAWEFFLSPGHNLVWCNVFKAASSTWMYYFNILGGYDIKYLQRTKTSPLELARKRFPRPKLNELMDSLINSVSFLTVREPFERLLSAYRDKLEGCRNKFYKVLAKQIIKTFRKNSLQKSIKFQKQQQQLKRHNTGPTFKEFLQFLIQNYKMGKHFDEHWTPIYSFCTPCSINYTLIAKIETFQRDTEYIIRQAGLEPLLLGKLPHNRMRKISNRSAHNTKSLIEKYFSQIDRKTLDEVAKIYRLDFELFGYNITKYYDIVQPNEIINNHKTVTKSTKNASTIVSSIYYTNSTNSMANTSTRNMSAD